MFKEIKNLFFLFFLLSLILAIFPTLDILFSSFFYKGNNQFVVQHYLVGWVYFYEFIIRDVFMPLIVIFLLFFPILIKFFTFTKNRFYLYDFNYRDISYIWLSTAIVAFVVSYILKNNLGRARPVDTIEFGGDKEFSSWIKYSSECIDNCSFVSGDSSVGFFIACLYFITKKIKFFYISIAAGLIIGLVRVGAGGHFLSDVLMSFVIVNFILLILYFYFEKWNKTKT